MAALLKFAYIELIKLEPSAETVKYLEIGLPPIKCLVDIKQKHQFFPEFGASSAPIRCPQSASTECCFSTELLCTFCGKQCCKTHTQMHCCDTDRHFLFGGLHKCFCHNCIDKVELASNQARLQQNSVRPDNFPAIYCMFVSRFS